MIGSRTMRTPTFTADTSLWVSDRDGLLLTASTGDRTFPDGELALYNGRPTPTAFPC